MSEQKKKGKETFFFSLQIKYAMSYLAILAVVLILLNSYPILATQNLLFRSKQESLRNQTLVISSALMELESLSGDQVERVITMLGISGGTAILVTDPSGLVIYDSTCLPSDPSEEDAAEGDQAPQYRYALMQEIVLALRGYDTTHSRYKEGRFISTATAPVIYRGMTIGAVLIYEEDVAQGILLEDLQKNLRSISIAVAAVALVMSTIFSRILTGRFTALLRAIRIVGEGEYGHRLQPTGRDELTMLAEEFNTLTDRLQNTEEVRRRFVSDASHELKTPLASIRLLSDSILQDTTMDDITIRDFVSDIGEESDRLTRITEHLLALTRLDSLPVTNCEVIDVCDTLERVLSGIVPLADSVGISIEHSTKPGCTILCTHDDLHQIFFNLLENAVKYNRPDGRVMISVCRDDDQVMIEVADTGVGIPESDLPMIFNRFYRVDKARSRSAGGTGLGLAIVRDTVRRHGGWISAVARQPEGTVFSVGFPWADPAKEGEEQ